MVVATVISAEDPIELGQPNRCSHPRIGTRFGQRARKASQPDSGVEGEPRGRLVMVLQEGGLQNAPDRLALAERKSAACGVLYPEPGAVVLRKTLESDACVVFSGDCAQRGLSADVV